MLKRKCGSCTGCCFAPSIEVPELKKEKFCNCPNQTETGCGIYNSRPQICKDFSCLWLDEELHVKDRPDKIGMVLFRSAITFGNCIMVMELKPNAIDEAVENGWFDQFGEQLLVMKRLDGTSSFLNPTYKILQAINNKV